MSGSRAAKKSPKSGHFLLPILQLETGLGLEVDFAVNCKTNHASTAAKSVAANRRDESQRSYTLALEHNVVCLRVGMCEHCILSRLV